MSGLTAMLTISGWLVQETRLTIWAVARPIISSRQAATATNTRVLVRRRRLRRRAALVRPGSAVVTVSFDQGDRRGVDQTLPNCGQTRRALSSPRRARPGSVGTGRARGV